MNSRSALLALSLFSFVAASHACGEQSVESVGHRRAVKRIEALPEYKDWRLLISARPGVHPARLPAVDQQLQIGRRCYWSVAIYEDHESHLHLWQTFLVSQDGRYVLVEDLEGNPIPISKWRASQRSRQNAA